MAKPTAMPPRAMMAALAPKVNVMPKLAEQGAPTCEM